MARTWSATSGIWRGGVGRKILTKSKSMATEEIELNRRLEEDYDDLELEIVETDLGEWIAQLAGETPSHIVGPILHMNKWSGTSEILSGVSRRRTCRRTLSLWPPSPGSVSGKIRERRHRDQGGELRGRRDGDHRPRHQRGQRAAGTQPSRGYTSS